jgi:multidrug resistance efflux pump
LPNSAKTWFTIPIWMVLLLFFLFFPMQLGAPSGPVTLLTYSVSVIPNVVGTVTDMIAETNQPLKKGDVLFKIHPRPFRYLLEAKKAALAESEQMVP